MPIRTPPIISALYEPESDVPFYVGQTHNLAARFYSHVQRSRTAINPTKKEEKITSLVGSGKEITMKVLAIGRASNANSLERYWINHYRSLGVDLKNGKRTKETKI